MNSIKVSKQLPAIGIALMLYLPGLNYCLSTLLEYVYNSRPVSVYIYLLLLASLFGGVYFLFQKKDVNRTAIIVSLVILVGTAISYILYPNIRSSLITDDHHIIYSEAIYMALFCIPSMLLASSNKDWDVVIKLSYYIAPVVVVVGIYTYYSTIILRSLSDDLNYMSFAYSILTGGCVCLYAGLKDNKWILALFGIIALIAVVVGGSRGSAVCFVLFILLMFFYKGKGQSKHKYIRYIIVVGFVIYLLFYTGLLNFIESGDVYFRNISKFESGDFAESDSRDMLKVKLLNAIYSNPIGYGFFGDRHVLKGPDGGIYAHNIFLEIICDFGWVFGLIFIFYLLKNLYKIIRYNQNKDLKTVLLFVLPTGFFALLFSDSFLISPAFFIMLGMIFNVRKTKGVYSPVSTNNVYAT